VVSTDPNSPAITHRAMSAPQSTNQRKRTESAGMTPGWFDHARDVGNAHDDDEKDAES